MSSDLLNFKLLCLIITLVLINCQEPTKGINTNIKLQDHEVVSTSVILEVKTEKYGHNHSILIKRNDNNISGPITISKKDTLIIDKGLAPAESYQYVAYLTKNENIVDSSEVLFIQTLPLTSHDFTWDMDTLGLFGSYFRDASIISEDNIWAVGELWLPDSFDNVIDGYKYKVNVSQWDGGKWQFKNELTDYNHFKRLRGVCTISEKNIWSTLGSQIYHYDGNNAKYIYQGPNSFEEGDLCKDIEVVTDNILYFAGRKGWLVRCEGETCEKIYSGIDNSAPHWMSAIEDVVTTPDESRLFVMTEYYVLEVYEDTVDTLFVDDDIDLQSQFVEFQCFDLYGDILYICAPCEGMIKYNINTGLYTIDENAVKGWNPVTVPFECHVKSPNNIYLLGYNGEFIHYNGDTWYEDNSNDRPGVYFYQGGGDVKGNTIVMAGALIGGGAIIIRGHHNF